MKVTLTLHDGEVRKLTPRFDDAVAEGCCPACKGEPFQVAGTGRSIESHDTYRADGVCLRCKKRVGVIRAKLDTIFGLEEDERVAAFGCRVY